MGYKVLKWFLSLLVLIIMLLLLLVLLLIAFWPPVTPASLLLVLAFIGLLWASVSFVYATRK